MKILLKNPTKDAGIIKIKDLLQIVSYSLFIFIWIYGYLDKSGFGIISIFFNFLFVSLFLVLFAKKNFKSQFKIVINLYVFLIFLLGVVLEKNNIGIIVSGFNSMIFFSLVAIPWLFCIKILTTEFNNKMLKIIYCSIAVLISLAVTIIIINTFFCCEI